MSRGKRVARLRNTVDDGPGREMPQLPALWSELEDLRCRVRELSVLLEVHSAMAPLASPDQLLSQTIVKIGRLLDVEKAGVMLYDRERNELVLQRPAFGVDDGDLMTYCAPLKAGGNDATLFLTGEPYLSNDCFNDSSMVRNFIRLFDARSVITVPLSIDDRCIGVLHVCNKRSGLFDQKDLQLLRLLATHLAALIKNAKLYEREQQRIHELEKLNQVILDQRDKLQQAMAIHEKLTEVMLQGSGIDGITRTLANLVENPVAVEDRFFQLISYAPYPPSSRSHKPSFPTFTGTPASALSDLRFREQIRLMKCDGRPVQIPAYPQYGLHWSRLSAAITVGKTTLGYVSILEKNRQSSQFDTVAIEHAITVLALEMQRQKTASEVEQRLKGEFLDDLLMGNYESGDVMLRRAAFLDYGLSRPHVVMVVDIDRSNGFLSKYRLAKREAASVSTRLFDLVQGVVAGASANSMVVSRDESIVVLLNLLPDPWDDDRLVDPKEVAETIRQKVGKHLAQLTISIAISGQCERPEDYKRSYQIARKSLDIVKTYNQFDRVVSFDKLGAYQLLLQIEDKAQLKDFVDRLIGPLIDYDQKHNACLMETLDSYLQNDCNLQKTARVGFVHANTLKYRLQRIEEIAELDLSDTETRLNLHLGMKVWRLIH